MNLSSQFSKIPKQEKSIFSIISDLAKQYNAIDLSMGYSDFINNENPIELACKYMKSGQNHYAPAEGIPELRKIIASKTNSKYESNYNSENEITITNGASDAIFTTITAFIREKDEVIIFEPAFNSYAAAVRVNGGIPVFIDMKSPKFHFDWEKLQMSLTANTRMIIINNPQNPTGATLTAWDIEKIKKIVRGTDILILSDEVYWNQTFDGLEHESLAKEPSLFDRTIIIDSLCWTFALSGWKLGYILAPKHLTTEFRKVHQFAQNGANTPLQYAFFEFLTSFSDYNSITIQYEQKRNLLYNLLKDSKYKLKKSKGSMFQCIDYSDISDENDFEFASKLIRDYKIASIPLSYLYKAKTDNKILRLNFAHHDDKLKQAAENLLNATI